MKAEKGSHNYNYVNQILYDKFGNRKYIAYGNGTATTYNYDHANLRMTHLQTVTANGRLIQNNHYEYDAVGNILSLNNEAEITEHETLYGGPTTNRYSYDNRYQLISAEGTHQGYDKQHKYNLTMEYGATGKILRKTQNNQWRKTDGDWNSDAETTVDYRYTYDGQKPHAVSSITNGVTETLHTFTYDASGNNLLETNSKASSDRQMVWTEDNRLASIKARGNINHYLYDANGIRTLKMSSSSFNISVNGVEAGSSAVDGNFTIYANPYAVVRKNQYTKHYFLGTQRILTKIGNSEVEKTFFEGYAENIVPNVDYQGKQDDLENKFVLNNELLNVGWYRETRGRIPSQHIKHYLRSKEYGGQSGVNPWGNEDSSSSDIERSRNAEDKQYYFHPDHLGSTNYLTDVTGEAYQHVAYLPWGEIFVEQRNTQSSRNTFLYTGKELDEETGLYYYEQRYMNPKFSIFLGVDPLLDKFPEWGAYTYTFNNPIRFIDPDGRSGEEAGGSAPLINENKSIMLDEVIVKGRDLRNNKKSAKGKRSAKDKRYDQKGGWSFRGGLGWTKTTAKFTEYMGDIRELLYLLSGWSIPRHKNGNFKAAADKVAEVVDLLVDEPKGVKNEVDNNADYNIKNKIKDDVKIYIDTVYKISNYSPTYYINYEKEYNKGDTIYEQILYYREGMKGNDSIKYNIW